MKIIADLHTHTMVSQHAYSTIYELSLAAKEKGLRAIAVTDHGPGMPDGAIAHHFYCLAGLPKEVNGLTLYKGAETNIMDYNGTLDMDSSFLSRLDFVIASYHVECIAPLDIAAHTRGWLGVIENPDIDCLGHCGNPAFSMDAETVVKACAKHGKIIEINASSFLVRPGSDKTCCEIAKLCKKYGVRIVVNSDAHSAWHVGELSRALVMLEEIQFPQELILNASEARLQAYFKNK